MKKIILAGMMATLMVGCKGPKGDQGAAGPTGPIGPAGPGKITLFSGTAFSDLYTVTDSRLNTTSNIAVYVSSDGSTWFQLNIFNPVSGFNSGYSLGTGSIRLFNLVTNGNPKYSIVIVSQSAPQPSSWAFGSPLLE